MTLARARRLPAVMLAATALAAALAGCGADEPELPTPVAPRSAPAEPSPTTPTLAPAEAEALEAVLTLHDAYLTAYVEFATTEAGVAPGADRVLLEFAEPDFATEARNQVIQNFIDGRIFAGDLSGELLELVAADLDREVDGEERPQVVVSLCVDASSWETVDLNTGEPVADPPGRYVSTITAEWRDQREFGPEGWALAAHDDDRSQSC